MKKKNLIDSHYNIIIEILSESFDTVVFVGIVWCSCMVTMYIGDCTLKVAINVLTLSILKCKVKMKLKMSRAWYVRILHPDGQDLVGEN